MASSSLQHAVHPLQSLASDSDLSVIFELEDPFLMPLERFEELIRSTEPGELQGYLWGLFDQRRAAVYSGAQQREKLNAK